MALLPLDKEVGEVRLSMAAHSGDRRRRRRTIAQIVAVGVVGTISMALASPAWAGSETFMQDGQGLSAGVAKASSSFHTGVTEVHGSADHTHCPAVAQGYGGYTSSPFGGGNFTAYLYCGPGWQQWLPNGTANYNFHGAEYNPNDRTFDTFSYARYYW